MSYSRGKYYIWGGLHGIEFCVDGKCSVLSDDEINVFIASLFKRKKEFKLRRKLGNKLIKENKYD